jgi:phosphocarrier protein
MEATVPIVNSLGLHARPAAEFVKTSARFKAAVLVRKDSLEVNGKSIMGMMMLAAERGSELYIRTEGDDAEAALAALVALIAAGFNEE